MANNDQSFINYGGQGSGADITIQPQASGGTRFLSSFMGGLMQGGGAEAKQKKEKDKLSYYSELRKAGYSPDEATKRVNKQYSGGLLNKVLGKTDAGFQPPSGAGAEEDEKKAKAGLMKAQTDWYSRRSGQPSGEGSSGTSEKIKSLQSMIAKTQDDLQEATTANKPQDVLRKRLGKYQSAYDKLVGAGDEDSGGGNDSGGEKASMPKKDSSWGVMPQYVPGQTRPGQKFKHGDKTYMVDPDNPGDPNDPNVLPAE